MRITKVSACGLLSFRDFDLALDQRVTVLVGPNGTGKSNFHRLLDVVTSAVQRADRDSPDLRKVMERVLSGRRTDLDEHGIELRVGFHLTEVFERAAIVTFVRACAVHALVGNNYGFETDSIEAWAEQSITGDVLEPLFAGDLVLQHRGTPDAFWQCGVEFQVEGPRVRWVMLGDQPDSIRLVDDLGRNVKGIQLNDRLRGATQTQNPTPTNPEAPFSITMLVPPVGSSIACALDLGRQPPPRAFRDFAEQIGVDPLGASGDQSRHYGMARVFSIILRRSAVTTTDSRLLPNASDGWSTTTSPLRSGAEGQIPETLLKLKNGLSTDHQRYREVQTLFREFTHGRAIDVALSSVDLGEDETSSQNGLLGVVPLLFVSVNSLQDSELEGPYPQVQIDLAGAGAWEALVLATVFGSKTSSLIVLDEPAVALHPNLQRRLMMHIQRSTAQCVVITHSPYLYPLDIDPSEVKVVRFDRDDRSATRSHCIDATMLRHMALKLRQTGNERIVFSSQVILCEGTSDQAGIRALAEASHIELDENNVAIVDCDGRDNIPAYARFCSALGLKYLAVQDGDASKSAAQTGVEAVRRAVNESDLGALFEFPENIETSLGGVQKDSERVADAMRQSAKRSSVAPEITELIEILSTFVGNATQLG